MPRAHADGFIRHHPARCERARPAGSSQNLRRADLAQIRPRLARVSHPRSCIQQPPHGSSTRQSSQDQQEARGPDEGGLEANLGQHRPDSVRQRRGLLLQPFQNIEGRRRARSSSTPALRSWEHFRGYRLGPRSASLTTRQNDIVLTSQVHRLTSASTAKRIATTEGPSEDVDVWAERCDFIGFAQMSSKKPHRGSLETTRHEPYAAYGMPPAAAPYEWREYSCLNRGVVGSWQVLAQTAVADVAHTPRCPDAR